MTPTDEQISKVWDMTTKIFEMMNPDLVAERDTEEELPICIGCCRGAGAPCSGPGKCVNASQPAKEVHS